MTIKKLNWYFHFLVLIFLVGVIIYNQNALFHIRKNLDELNQEWKKSLLLTHEEFPIKKVLDQKSKKNLTELEKIKISKRIALLQRLGVEASFTLDLIYRESTFNPKALSKKGAIGLMQLMPSTAKWLSEKGGVPWKGDELLYDPIKNVELGTAYLAYLSQEFKGEKFLRAAYQSGPYRVKKKYERRFYAKY